VGGGANYGQGGGKDHDATWQKWGTGFRQRKASWTKGFSEGTKRQGGKKALKREEKNEKKKKKSSSQNWWSRQRG